ncbi:MAG: MBL fold metallo-hydrolase [Thermaerobacter sp.]|nr:MBL fold metallo-hydrolase [Thermaerobacter sp.]
MYKTDWFTVQEVGDGVYAAIAKPGSGAGSNAGIVDLGGSALVFDSLMTPAAGAALLAAAQHLTGQKVRYLALSHRDYDHVMGAQAFPQAVVIATRLTDSVMRRRVGSILASSEQERANLIEGSARQVEEARPAGLRRERQGFLDDLRALMAVHDALAPHYADLLFDRSITVAGSRRRVDLHTFGAVHTESDAVAYLPDQGILFSGDIVQVGNHPAVRCGGPDEWDSVLQPIAALRPRVVVSGHGPIGGAEAIDLTRRYLAQLPAMSTEELLVEPFRRWAASDVWRQNLRYLEGLREGS